jgi:hypothetical protein
MNFGLQKAQGGKKTKVCFWFAGHENFFTLQKFHDFFIFIGRGRETINTLCWFILDVMIEAKKWAWTDLLLQHLQLKTPNNSFILQYNTV